MHINANDEFLLETKKKGFLLLTGLVKTNSYNYKKTFFSKSALYIKNILKI